MPHIRMKNTVMVHTYIHTYIHNTYIHTYIHTCIHRPRFNSANSQFFRNYNKFRRLKSGNASQTYEEYSNGIESPPGGAYNDNHGGAYNDNQGGAYNDDQGGVYDDYDDDDQHHGDHDGYS